MRKWIAACIAAVMALAMSATAFAADETITAEKAKEIALTEAGLTAAQVSRLKAEFDNEDNLYEVEFLKTKNRAEFDYEIAADGTILEKSVDLKYKHNRSRNKISKKKARKIVANHAKADYSTVKKGKCRYEYDDHEGTYDVKFREGKLKYDYELLAPTGKIIEYGYKVVR